eukprot:1160922-Pelagomonas_calceolata.AAC.3
MYAEYFHVLEGQNWEGGFRIVGALKGSFNHPPVTALASQKAIDIKHAKVKGPEWDYVAVAELDEAEGERTARAGPPHIQQSY